MYTVEEARKKECPHMQYCVNPQQAYDGNFAIMEQRYCIADECMAWRWSVVPLEGRSRATHGYCGLSGRPE